MHQSYNTFRLDGICGSHCYFILPTGIAVRSRNKMCDPLIHGIRYRKKRGKKESRYFKPIILGCACAAGLLVIVLPLLVNSDKIFAVFFGRFTGWFRFGAELGVILTFLAGYILMYAFLSGISALNIKEKENVKQLSLNSVTGITFSGILAVIYVFYSAIQILFLFLRFESGLPESVTYSQYAHAGFWQLLAVSIINFITVLICVSIFEENKILKIILMIISVCTCIMTLSAAYRMILYVRAYHLTFLRVLVLWFLGVLLLIMVGVMLSIIRKKFQLFKYIMVVLAVCYIALSFAAAQFIGYFNYTKLGTILALKGADVLGHIGAGGPVLMVLFILLAAVINLFMGSASAKWTILAPVFVPMFMLLGYSPELVQVAYRIGDSATNLITPLMAYFAMVVVFAKKYDDNSGIGTLVSTMLPYCICFLIGWSLLLILWMGAGLPLGPGAGLMIS